MAVIDETVNETVKAESSNVLEDTKLDPYLVMTDGKGVLAFQPLTRDHWEKCTVLAALSNTRELFKIKLTYQEANSTRFLLKKHFYRAAAYHLTRIRLERGDFVE